MNFVAQRFIADRMALIRRLPPEFNMHEENERVYWSWVLSGNEWQKFQVLQLYARKVGRDLQDLHDPDVEYSLAIAEPLVRVVETLWSRSGQTTRGHFENKDLRSLGESLSRVVSTKPDEFKEQQGGEEE